MRTLARLVLSLALLSQIVASSSVLAQEAKADPPKGPVTVEYECAIVAWACPRKLSATVEVRVPKDTPIEERDQAVIDKLNQELPGYTCPNSTYEPRPCIIEDWHPCTTVKAERRGQWKVFCSYMFCNGKAMAFVGSGCSYSDAVRNANCIAQREAHKRCTRVRCREYCDLIEKPCSTCCN